jgi:hypothetical protein
VADRAEPCTETLSAWGRSLWPAGQIRFNIANAGFRLGRYDAAVEVYKRAVINYRPFIPYAYSAAMKCAP